MAPQIVTTSVDRYFASGDTNVGRTIDKDMMSSLNDLPLALPEGTVRAVLAQIVGVTSSHCNEV